MLIKSSVTFSPAPSPFILGIKAVEKINADDFRISVITGIPSQYYSMVSVLLIFIYVSLYSLLIFLNSYAPILVSGIFVEASLPQ